MLSCPKSYPCSEISRNSTLSSATKSPTFQLTKSPPTVFDEPDKLADFEAAVLSTGEVQELQDVLESLVVDDRLRKALPVLKKELINAQLQKQTIKRRRP